MGRLIGAIIIAVIFFIGGYFVGARKLGRMEKDLSATRAVTAAKDLMLEQKTELVKKLEQARLKLRFSEIKERLGDARSELMDKNYGAAESEIQQAKKTLDSLLGDAKDDLRKDLTPIVVGLDEVKDMIDKMDSKAKNKLETLRTQLEEIQKKHSE